MPSGADMEQAQELSSQAKEIIADKVMDSLGEPQKAAESMNDEAAGQDVKDELPLYAKERLGRQEKRHKKEIRMMQDQIQALQSRMGSPAPANNQATNPYLPMDQSVGDPEQDQIQKAIAAALHARDQVDAQKKNAEKEQLSRQQFQKMESKLRDELDRASEKYDDFDDVVRDQSAPYSEHMKNTALLLPNAAEVLYRLGQDKEKLRQLSELPPADQAREMIALSHALVGGQAKAASEPKPIGQIKSTPITSSAVTDKTSVGELRARMKAGWK